MRSEWQKIKEQECIPIGCVPAERWPYSGVWSRGGVYSQRKQKSKKTQIKIKIGGFPLNPPQLPPNHPTPLNHPPPKNWRRTPRKIGDTLPPRKIGDPLKNWRPPEKLEIPQKIGDPPEELETPRDQTPPAPRTDLQGMLGYPPPPPTPPGTDTRLWKYYLGQNFVSASKNIHSNIKEA